MARLEELVDHYNRAWSDHDVDAIVSMHTPDFVFHNHSTAERAEGDEAREHIATIFRDWPDIAFRARRIYVRPDVVVNEWTATATRQDGTRIEWDGVDVLPLRDNLIARKDVYSGSGVARVIG